MTTRKRGAVPLAARLFLVIALLVVFGVGTAVVLTWQVGERLGRAAVLDELDASTAAQRRFEDLGAEKLELIAQSIANDASVANYLEGAIGGNLGLEGGADPYQVDPADELGMGPVTTEDADDLGLEEAADESDQEVDEQADDEAETAGAAVLTAGSEAAVTNVSVQDLLEERRETQGVSLAMVLDPDGQLVARTGETEAFERDFKTDTFLGPVIAELNPVVGYWEEGGNLYHAAATPIAAELKLLT